MEQLPWLDYAGQTTAELLACKHSHRIDSLLCALEIGIQNKREQQGDESVNDAERTVLAVMALDREVNNGGYHQFFFNPSVEFAPIIIGCLLHIESVTVAAITAKAVEALGVPVLTEEAVSDAMAVEDSERDAILDGCDSEFYQTFEIEPKLFAFVEVHWEKIHTAQ